MLFAVICCLLLVVCCLLLFCFVCRVLFDASCLLFVVVCGLSFVVGWSLCVDFWGFRQGCALKLFDA